jgi:uncharacterized protein (TIGR03086 family)
MRASDQFTKGINEMTDPLARLARALHQTSEVIGDIRPDQATDPTPCQSWDVHTLVSHVVAGLDNFIAAAAGERPHWDRERPQVTGDWQAAFDARSPELIKTWRRVDDLEAPIKLPVGEVPSTFVINQQVAELVVHAWDLAQATGQTRHWDDEIAADALQWARGALKPEYRGDEASGKSFGPEQTPAADAGPTEQLAAFFGRAT